MDNENNAILDAKTVEKLFCLAVLPEGSDVTNRVMSRFINYREKSDEVLVFLDSITIHDKMGSGAEQDAQFTSFLG